MSREKRQHLRRALSLFVGDRRDELLMGVSQDVSLGGLFVQTAQRLAERHTIFLRLGKVVIACACKVVRREEGGAGLVFEEPDQERDDALRTVLSETRTDEAA